jgi:hypothetical protein
MNSLKDTLSAIIKAVKSKCEYAFLAAFKKKMGKFGRLPLSALFKKRCFSKRNLLFLIVKAFVKKD